MWDKMSYIKAKFTAVYGHEPGIITVSASDSSDSVGLQSFFLSLLLTYVYSLSVFTMARLNPMLHSVMQLSRRGSVLSHYLISVRLIYLSKQALSTIEELSESSASVQVPAEDANHLHVCKFPLTCRGEVLTGRQ